jgi:hypothetical protein
MSGVYCDWANSRMSVVILIMALPTVAGAAGLVFGLLVRRGWILTAFALAAPSPVLLAASIPRNGFSEQGLLLVGAYYALLVVAAVAGILLAPVMRRWWDARTT